MQIIKLKYKQSLFFCFSLFTLCSSFISLKGQGLIVNEFSNGAAGSEEYVELVVVGSCGGTVDIRGFIFDDNNGIDDATCQGFSTTSGSAGTADGHFRFSYIARWTAVRVGSIILVYNAGEKNASITLADDPTDSNSDYVYVLPHNDSGIEVCTTLPTTADCSFSPCIYGPPGSWNPAGLRNNGDAMQVRNPNGSYFHGLSYGNSTNNMTGGPDNLNVDPTSSHSGKVSYFNCGDYRTVSNYSTGAVSSGLETPGAVNNINNQEFINYERNCLGDNCTYALPIELLTFNAEVKDNSVHIKWITSSETNNYFFTIERTSEGINFEVIAIVDGSGNSNQNKSYQYTDSKPKNGVCYYRLKQTDYDGNYTYSKLIAVQVKSSPALEISNLASNRSELNFTLNFGNNTTSLVKITDILGKDIYTKEYKTNEDYIPVKINMELFPTGLYILNVTNGNTIISKKFVLQ